jgi:hypothetical protein
MIITRYDRCNVDDEFDEKIYEMSVPVMKTSGLIEQSKRHYCGSCLKIICNKIASKLE